MRLALICVVLILAVTAINSIRGGAGYPLPQVLPGCGGPGRPLVYTLGGVAMLGLCWWGLSRSQRIGKDDDEQ